jgi:hypothetical protein
MENSNRKIYTGKASFMGFPIKQYKKKSMELLTSADVKTVKS